MSKLTITTSTTENAREANFLIHARASCPGIYQELGEDRPPLFLVGPSFASRVVSSIGYISQLAAPPKDFAYKELHAAHKVLHIPVSIDVDTIYNLSQLGGVSLTRPIDYCRSCMVRASVKTIQAHGEQHATLPNAAVEGALMGREPGTCAPQGWDSSAFCTNLHWASIGLRLRDGFSSSTIVQCLKAYARMF